MGDDLPRSLTRAAVVTAALAALGAALAAFVHASPALVGGLAALVAFATAFALAATARALHAPDDVREPRTVHATRALEPLPGDVTRRGVFDRFWLYAAGAFAVLGIVPFVALARNAAPSGTKWRAGARLVTPDGVALRADDLAVGGVETVFPEGHVSDYDSTTLLLRLPSDAVGGADRRDWMHDGNVAFSKICTHAGCPVALYRQASLELYCPCHQSVFDVVHAARPVSGPATRALPQLALDVDPEGYLIARGDFSGPIGPDSWGRTA